MALTSVALTDLRQYIKRRIVSAKYYIGTTAYPATIKSILVLSSGVVRVALSINPSTAATVTKAELYNVDGELWASQSFSVKLTESAQKILYWFDFIMEEG